MDRLSKIGNKSLKPTEKRTNMENIVLYKGTNTTPPNITIVHNESVPENQPEHSRKRKGSVLYETAISKKSSRKRKGSVFDETAISKKSVTELKYMVDQNNKHMEFLSACGKLSNNRESVILEDINNLLSIIQQKQSLESCNHVFERHKTLKDCSQLVSCKIYKYHSFSIVGQ